MELLTKEQIFILSFPDYSVEEMELDNVKKCVMISTNGGYLDTDDGVRLKNCQVLVSNWEKLKISLYDVHTKEWQHLRPDCTDELTDICEFYIEEALMAFRGFGRKTGQWVEYLFTNAEIEVQCEF